MHAGTITDSADYIQTTSIVFARLSVCRQIYAESSPMIYTLNIFEIDCKRVADFLSDEFDFDLIPSQGEGIRVIEVTARQLL
jgi:hypothetical protein